jgi:hypothetical protein
MLVSSLFIAALVLGAGPTEEYTKVLEPLRVFQEGKDIDLLLTADANAFTISQGKTSPATEAEFKALQEKATGLQLKILQRGKEAYSYYAGFDQRLQLTMDENGNATCNKIVFSPLGRYPVSQWPDFVRTAVPKGLTRFGCAGDESAQEGWVVFRQIDPTTVRVGTQTLDLSEEFYRHMRLSRQVKSQTGTTGRFVVFVHEPHWCIPGQHQLIAGIKALLDGNPRATFKFLVEGYFEEEIKDIPTGPTLAVLAKNASVTDQVHAMVREHLIDGPFAFRLLHAPNLPAMAIDDPEEIKATPSETAPDFAAVHNRCVEFMQKLEQQNGASTQNLQAALFRLVLLLGADPQDVDGAGFVRYYEELQKLVSTLQMVLRGMSDRDATQFSSSLQPLNEHCTREVSTLKHALNRDGTMAGNITRCMESGPRGEILVAFIGSFHTRGIIDRLPAGTGYVVLEPRTAAEEGRYDANFMGLLRPESRPAVLRRISRTLKLPVAPLPRELPDYQEFLKNRAAATTARDNAFKSSSPLSAAATENILTAVRKNVVLGGASIRSGGDTVPPVAGAFASFPADPGREPALVLIDRDEKNWSRPDRLRFLASVLPLAIERPEKGRMSGVTFYQDWDTAAIFFCTYHQDDQKYYLCEWPHGLDMSKALALPKGILHLLLARQIEREEEHDGAQG